MCITVYKSNMVQLDPEIICALTKGKNRMHGFV